jgi:hypothetical protein
MRLVRLYDGREVDSSSEEWRQQCEAVTILAMSPAAREGFWVRVAQKRGAEAVDVLKRRCLELEPHYVLSLPNKRQRQVYLEHVEHRFGPNPRKTLESKILALHHARVASETGQTA